ncbi:MFS transporter [Actinacidiphila glaucinigra]|uniref:Fucose permease n=1 Tax=Actinacidiphila glaucinigra TaxID=235986 RepID=A0A239LWG7_9ACTN|nr:MFS transporter [Actinacidiphila glaucinigra]SNT34049.1 Fucose permease [Actinacidiphila glaucinigra]
MVTTTATPAVAVLSPPATARRLLTGYFVGMGALMAVWGARMPAVQSAAHLSAGQLSLVLLGAAAGMVAGLYAGGRIAQRRGPAVLLTAPAVVLALALAALGGCRTLPTLIAAALVFGLAHGLLDVGANVAAVQCQDAYGRSIMASLHAGFSVGALFGAAAAAMTALTPHSRVFLIAGLAAAAAALLASPVVRSISDLPSSPANAHDDPAGPGASGRATGLWLLGALAAACLLAEGAAADWSAVHLHGLHATTAISASAYAVYSAAMATGRLAGDCLTTRYGAPVLVRVGAVLAFTGLGAGLLVGTTWAALASWAALGLGLSTTVPALITAAGRHGPRAVAAVTATGYIGLLAGPAAIGALAALTGSVPVALALPVLLAAAVAVTSRHALETSR